MWSRRISSSSSTTRARRTVNGKGRAIIEDFLNVHFQPNKPILLKLRKACVNDVIEAGTDWFRVDHLIYYINKRLRDSVSLYHPPSEEDILFGSIPKNVRDVLRRLFAIKAADLEEMLFRVAKENHVPIDDILSFCEWIKAERSHGNGSASDSLSEIPGEIKEKLKSLLRMNPTANETIRKIWASRFTFHSAVKQEAVLSYLRHLEEDGVGDGDNGQSSLSDRRRQLTHSTTAASHTSTQDSAFPDFVPQEQSRTHSLSPVRDGHDNGRRSTTLVNTSGVEQQGCITSNDEHSSGTTVGVNLPTPTSVLSERVGEELSRTQSVSPLRDGRDDTRRSETLVDSPGIQHQSHIADENELGAGIYDPITATTELQGYPVSPETPHSPPAFQNAFPTAPCNSGDSLTSEQELLFLSEELPKSTESVDGLNTNVQDARATRACTVNADLNMENKSVIMSKPGSKSDTVDGERSEFKDMDVDTELAREALRLERSREEPPQPGDARSKEIRDETSMDVDLEPVPKNMRELLAWIEKREGPLDNLLLIGGLIKAGMEK